MFKHILVTTDGSPEAGLALPHAAELARCCGSVLTVLHVVPLPGVPLGLTEGGAALYDPAEEFADRMGRGEAALAAAKADLPGTEPKLALVMERAGGVAGTVAEEVESRGADLVVMATHGRTGLAHLLLGSVAEAVMHKVRVPVLLVRSAARPHAAEAPGVADGARA